MTSILLANKTSTFPDTSDLEKGDFSEIDDIKFYHDRNTCITCFENTHWSKKAISLIQSFGTLLVFVFYKLGLILRRVESRMAHLTTADSARLSRKRLVVCIHGLHDNPSRFEKIVEGLQKKNSSETDIYVPYVLRKGNAKLDDMAKPIFEDIAKWANCPGAQELVLVGISNGARISRQIEVELAKSGTLANLKKLRVVSVVGACKGSSIINLTRQLCLSWLSSKNIVDEMPTDSKRNIQLSQEWTDALSTTPGLARDYTFIAAQNDWIVPNRDSTLMDANGEEARYALVPGHGHNSVINAVSNAVVDIIL